MEKKFPIYWMKLKGSMLTTLINELDREMNSAEGEAFWELTELRGYACFNLGQYAEAKRQFQVVVAERPSIKNAWAMGTCAVIEGDWMTARKAFDKAIRMGEWQGGFEGQSFLNFYLCHVLVELKDFAGAEKILEEILKDFIDIEFVNEWNLLLKGRPFLDQVLWLANDVWSRRGTRRVPREFFFAWSKALNKEGKFLVNQWVEDRRLLVE